MGISVQDALFAQCKGSYGSQPWIWSISEQQEACGQYDRLYGERVLSGYETLALVVCLVVLVTVTSLFVHRFYQKTRRHTK